MKKISIFLMVVCMLASAAAVATASSMLEITDVEVTVDGDDETASDGDVVDDAKPGSDLEIKVEVTNRYADRDQEIEDIEIEIIGSGLDEDDDDWEPDEEEIDDLRGDDEDDVDFSYTIPWDVDDGEHSITITAEGDCPNETHNCSDELEFDLEIEKDKHKLVFQEAELNPDTLECDSYTTLTVRLYNIGEEDEDDVELTVENRDLEISMQETFDLETCPDDDCSITRTFEIEHDDSYEQDSYPLEVKVVYDDGDETETERLNLNVLECEEEEEEEVIVLGCTDPEAINYNPSATMDDGSCEYEVADQDGEEEDEEEMDDVPEAVPISEGEAVAPYTVEEIAVVSLIILGILLVLVLVVFLIVKAAKKE